MRKLLAFALSAALVTACLGSTGNTLVHFQAAAAGPPDAVAGQPLGPFTTDKGWSVVLTKVTLHVGAMYLVQTLPTSGGGASACLLPGTYVAQATTDPGSTAGIDVDLLSPAPQYFPNPGSGTDLAAKSAQVWLTGVEVDHIEDTTTILHVDGTASQNGQTIPFTGSLSIGQNRVRTPTDSSKPGSEPICRQRIVSPVLVDLVPRSSGHLLLRADPRPLFIDVDFSKLTKFSDAPLLFWFKDDSSDEPSLVLYRNLHSAGALYQFTWEDSP